MFRMFFHMDFEFLSLFLSGKKADSDADTMTEDVFSKVIVALLS